MNPELIRIVDGIARDKNIEREQIYTDIEQAIASGLRKQFNTEDTTEFQVQVDRVNGDISVARNGTAIPLSITASTVDSDGSETLAVTITGLPAGATLNHGTHNSDGSWTLISAQSNMNPPNTLSVTTLHDAVHVVMSGETHLDFTAKSDGHDTPVPGNPAFNQIVLHRINKKQVEVTEKKDGAVVATLLFGGQA